MLAYNCDKCTIWIEDGNNRGNWVWLNGNFLYCLYDFSVILKLFSKFKEFPQKFKLKEAI